MIRKILLLILVMGGIAGCSSEPTIVTLPVAETFVLQSEDFQSTFAMTGTVEAKRSVPLSSKISGRIDEFLVDIGDMVVAKQVVAQFSAVNDTTWIEYKNSVNQLRATELTTSSAVQTAQIRVWDAEQQHAQTQRQQQATLQQLFDTLRAQTNTSHTVTQPVLNFLDMTLGASPRFDHRNMASVILAIGSNDSVGRQDAKNKISELVQSNANEPFPYKQDPLENAQREIHALTQLQWITNDFYTLVKNTQATANFLEPQRQAVQQKVEQNLSLLSRELLALESQTRATETAQQQLALGTVQTQNAIESATAQLALAQATAQQQIQIAQNQIMSANTLQNELKLRAPFAGVITQKFLDEGELVGKGTPIFQLADRSLLKIETDIPDTQVGSITEKMPVEVQVDGVGDAFIGHITRIDPAVNPRTHTVGIEIMLDSAPLTLRIGMFARVSVTLPTKKTFFVPQRFIKFGFDGASVTTIDRLVIPVVLGAERTGEVEILAPDLMSKLVLRVAH